MRTHLALARFWPAVAIALPALAWAAWVSTRVVAQPAVDSGVRTVHSGEAIYHDNSLFTRGDNPTIDYSAFVPDCVDGDHSGGVNIDAYKDTVIADTCVGGIRTYRRMLVSEGDDPGEYGLKRMFCGEPSPGVYTPAGAAGTAGCNMGEFNWTFKSDQSNPVRFARFIASSEAAQVNHNLPASIRTIVTNTSGVVRYGTAVNPNGGLTIFKGGPPLCELAAVSGSDQGVTIFWDSTAGRLAVMLPWPSCAIAYVTLDP